MLRLVDSTTELPIERGWIDTVTPLGASAHARTNSPAHELCDDWRKLTSGRVALIERTNFYHWFGPLFASVPPGLLAELLAARGLDDHLTTLLRGNAEARAHLKAVPACVVGADREERELLEHVLGLLRVIEARQAAQAAVKEIERAAME